MTLAQAVSRIGIARLQAEATSRRITYTIQCHHGENPTAVQITVRVAPNDGAPCGRNRIRTNDPAKFDAWLVTAFPEPYREEDK